MIQSTHHHEGLEFTVIRFDDGTFQASHFQHMVGFGKTPLDACQAAHTAESGFALYPIIQHLNEQLDRAFDDCGSTEKHARLGGVGNDCSNWLEDYDNGLPTATYLAGFTIVCDALEAFAECGYEISTDDIWQVTP